MERKETKDLLETIENSIIKIENVSSSMLHQLRNGKKHGTKTYIWDIDNVHVNGKKNKAWSWRQGEMTIWTGYNNEGKSQFLIFMCILKALNEGKKFAFFSPENFPPDDFYDDVIHTLLGRSTDCESPFFDVSDEEYLSCIDRIKDLFFFVYPLDENGKPDFRIEKIEEVFSYLIHEHDIFSVIVDPFIKIRHEMNGRADHVYAADFMMDRINFTRKENVVYNLVMHQTTPTKATGEKNYIKPDLYKVKGGGTYADSTDNVCSIWRPERGADKLSTKVMFTSDKIKKQKLVGIPTEIEMDFDRRKNRYLSASGVDYFDGSFKKPEQPQVYNNDVFKKVEPAPF